MSHDDDDDNHTLQVMLEITGNRVTLTFECTSKELAVDLYQALQQGVDHGSLNLNFKSTLLEKGFRPYKDRLS